MSLIAAASLSAAEFSPALDTQLEKADSQDLISAIVILESPVDIRALDWRLHDEKATLQRRHEQVISAPGPPLQKIDNGLHHECKHYMNAPKLLFQCEEIDRILW